MTFDEYQKLALKTDINPAKGNNASHPGFMDKVLGIAGEGGEVAEKVKKILRDKSGKIGKKEKAELIKELGDVLWYTAVLAHYLGESFEKVASKNIAKLAQRNVHGKISGSGDNR